MTEYDELFYGEQRDGSARSASVVLPLVLRLLQIPPVVGLSVVDVGCGVGTWLAAAKDLGADITGVDGAWAVDAGLMIDATRFTTADLAHSVPTFPSRFDLALSLEVAEHLPPERSDSFVADLCHLSDVVLFSAAIPGQLGTDHVNLQLQHRWAERFAANGYTGFDLVRPEVWLDDRVDAWYRQNTWVYVRNERADLTLRASAMQAAGSPIMDVVHPELLAFWVRRATRPVSTGQALGLARQAAVRGISRRLRRR